MKAKLLALLGASAVMAASANAAPQYATDVFWNNNGTVDAGRDDPNNALGAPDQVGQSPIKFLSLGIDGFAVFAFGTPFEAEANVIEVTFRCNGVVNTDECGDFPESADVYVGNGFDAGAFDTDTTLTDIIGGFSFAGSIGNAAAQGDPGAVVGLPAGVFQFVLLVDTSTQGDDGFDVDAVGVVPFTDDLGEVPLPAGAILFAPALGALALRARRRNQK